MHILRYQKSGLCCQGYGFAGKRNLHRLFGQASWEEGFWDLHIVKSKITMLLRIQVKNH